MPFFFIAFIISCFSWTVAALTILDNKDSRLVYSNSGPQWFSANVMNGGGHLVSGILNNYASTAYLITWQESLGDGASVSLTFTGTRVVLIGTIANSGYNTTVDFFIDGVYISRFQHLVPGPQREHGPTSSYNSDIQLQYTLGDFANLAPAQHTFKAVSVGEDSLFVVDAIQYEASEAVPTSSTSSSSIAVSSSNSVTSSSTSKASSTISTTSISTSSSITSASTSSRSTTSTTTSNSDLAAAAMDVPASDSRIVYSPLGAWSSYSNARRATSCLDGTMSSSTANSSLRYNFTGSAIQVYTVSSLVGGNYSISIDAENQGIYTSYEASADPLTCSSRPLYAKIGLNNTQHTLVLTVQDHPSGSTQDTIQFVGFRTTSATPAVPSTDSTSGPNVGAIVGGVVGGVCGLLLIIFVILWWMRRQKRAEEELLAEILDEPHSSMSDDQFTPATRSQVYSPVQSTWVSGPVTSPGQTSTSQYPVSVTTAIAPSAGDTEDSLMERLTYYTLPPYHENVMQRPAARNLSEADINAISRRLGDVMRNQVGQNGDVGNMMPPRELIDHLVEEQLQPPTRNPEGTNPV